MRDQNFNGEWVDQYLRNKLSNGDQEAFETALLESSELQQELETALALRSVLERASENASASDKPEPPQELLEPVSGWRPMALAAAIVLAVISTVMWWKSGNDLATLERQMQAMSQPLTEVLTVPVNIMRSASSETPEVIIQKPQGRAAILLDIELGLQAREEAGLNFELVNAEGTTILAWQSAPTAQGRSTAMISNEQVPPSKLWLNISTAEGEAIEQRLLEFRE